MDRIEGYIPDELIKNLFEREYVQLDEASKHEADRIMDRNEYEACHNAILLIRKSQTDPVAGRDLKARVMNGFERNKSNKKSHKRSLFLKVAAVVLLVIANAALIHYYLGPDSAIGPAVSGSDTGQNSNRTDTFKSRNLDSIHDHSKDTVLALIPDSRYEIMDLGKYVLRSLFCRHEVRDRQNYTTRQEREENYSI